MKDAYKNIRLANTILESAEKLGMEADVLIDMGIQWLTGEIGRASCRERVCQYV